jgi:hypothetical protein
VVEVDGEVTGLQVKILDQNVRDLVGVLVIDSTMAQCKTSSASKISTKHTMMTRTGLERSVAAVVVVAVARGGSGVSRRGGSLLVLHTGVCLGMGIS